MSSYPQHEDNMHELFRLAPDSFKNSLREMGLDVDDHYSTWNYDDLVEIMSEMIIYIEYLRGES